MVKKGESREKGNLSSYPLKEVFLLFFILLIVTVVVFFTVELFLCYRRSFFRVKYVYVVGNEVVNTKFLVKESGIRRGELIFSCDPVSVVDNLMSKGLFSSVRVAKLYPDSVMIKLKERVPCMRFLLDGEWHLVSEDGVVFMRYEKRPGYLSFNPNTLVRLVVSDKPSRDILKKTVFYYEKLDKLGKIKYITVERHDYDVFHFDNGLNVEVNLIECGEESVLQLRRVWRRLSRDSSKIELVSICLGNKIAVKWRKGVRK